MKTMKLGKTGMDISRIGLGTWSIGGGSAWGGDHDLQTVVDTIREAPKAGVNLIDTAPGYNFGNSEKILGKALEGMNREDVKIITKCGVTWDQEMKGDLFNKVNGIQLYKNLNSESVKKEIEASLERLGTDYVDVYICRRSRCFSCAGAGRSVSVRCAPFWRAGRGPGWSTRRTGTIRWRAWPAAWTATRSVRR